MLRQKKNTKTIWWKYKRTIQTMLRISRSAQLEHLHIRKKDNSHRILCVSVSFSYFIDICRTHTHTTATIRW